MKKSHSVIAVVLFIFVALVAVLLGFVLGLESPLPWLVLTALAFIPYYHERKLKKEYVDWSEQYAIGIELIDYDHQRLVGMLNQVVSAVNFNLGDSHIRRVLSELIDYTKYHFSREEELMRAHNYPDLEEHLVQHKMMVGQIEDFSSRIGRTGSCEDEVCMDIYRYLKEWLVNHITCTDKDMGNYLTSKGVK